jgi:hypothetical protein
MAQLLTQMQQAGGREALMQTLLQRMGQDANTAPGDSQGLVVPSGDDAPAQNGDPNQRLLQELIARQLQGGSKREKRSNQARRQQEMLRKAEARLERAVERQNEMMARLEDLALACGFCPRCFGDKPSCPECRGKGVPGYYEPDPEAWEVYVQPSLYRLGLIKVTEEPDRSTRTREGQSAEG